MTPAKAKNESEKMLWHAYYRQRMRSATCTSCTCPCKSSRKGCGQFTPTSNFTVRARRDFEAARKERK